MFNRNPHFNYAAQSAPSIFRPANWQVTVTELEHAVLVRDGVAIRVLAPGRHWFNPRRAMVHRVPRTEQIMTAPGQETFTADGAAVRATASTTFTVADPLLAYRSGSWFEAIYLEVQLALRDAIGAVGLEDLLSNRAGLDGPTTERVAAMAADRGLHVSAVRVRDLTTPGELKRSVAEVVQARLAGQAALERARAETAALRSLANAARMAADNPTLLQLRLIQQMETSTGNTYVLHAGSLPVAPSLPA